MATPGRGGAPAAHHLAGRVPGRRAPASPSMRTAQKHAISRSVVPTADAPTSGSAATAARRGHRDDKWRRPTWWPDSAAAPPQTANDAAFDGDWEWVPSPKPAAAARPAGAPAEELALPIHLTNTSGHNDLSELARLAKPPAGAYAVLGAVCMALQIKPVRRRGDGVRTKARDDYMPAARKLLADSTDLLFRLATFDVRALAADPARRFQLERAVRKCSPEVVAKCCAAAVGLAEWLQAVCASAAALELQQVTRRPPTAAGYESQHTAPHVGVRTGIAPAPGPSATPWAAWPAEGESAASMTMERTSDDFCGWKVEPGVAGRKKPERLSSAEEATRVAQQNLRDSQRRVERTGDSVARSDFVWHQPQPPAAPIGACPVPFGPPLTSAQSGLLQHGPGRATFRGSTEFRDGLCGPGSAAWAAETGAPAGVPRPARPPLGIQILGGEFHQMLPGGAVLPAEASQRFSMSHDNQRESHGCRS